jgi:hypothetical protein
MSIELVEVAILLYVVLGTFVSSWEVLAELNYRLTEKHLRFTYLYHCFIEFYVYF